MSGVDVYSLLDMLREDSHAIGVALVERPLPGSRSSDTVDNFPNFLGVGLHAACGCTRCLELLALVSNLQLTFDLLLVSHDLIGLLQ